MFEDVVGETDRVCQACVVMPNLKPPVCTPERVEWYKWLCEKHMEKCRPLITAKMMPWFTPSHIKDLHKAGASAIKIYPEGVTTNSEDGLGRDFFMGQTYPGLWDCFRQMSDLGMVLCLHGEMPGEEVLDREMSFVSWFLDTIANRMPQLRIVLEHITTLQSVSAVRRLHKTVAATITLHHLKMTLDDVIGGKLKPHNFCAPVAKPKVHREALLEAAFSGEPWFFLGSDSAPHSRKTKECTECCAGCFTAPVLAEQLYELFLDAGRLDKFAGFTSQHGLKFYGLKDSGRKISFRPHEWIVNDSGEVRPWAAGQKLHWICDCYN
jgi:dihydroorotase